MKKIMINRWIFLVVLALIIQISANLSDYRIIFEDDHFLTEGILQLLPFKSDPTDPDGIILAGKNYIAREVFIHKLTTDQDFKPTVNWTSENLFEERSIIWIAAGKFTSNQNQLLAISNSQYYLYQFDNNHANLLKQEKHSLQPLNIASGDLDGDGQSEVLIVRVGKITSKIYNGMIQVWRFHDQKFSLLAESDLIGNIRGIAAGDIDQDGRDEIFVDEGNKFTPGNLHVFRLQDKQIKESFCLKKAAKGPLYGMQVKEFSDGLKLVTASATGFINFFSWSNNALVASGTELNLDRDIMSLAVVDRNQDKEPELIVAAYPQDFLILAK